MSTSPKTQPEIGFVFRNGDIGECTVTKVWQSRFGDWKVSYADKRGGGGHMNLDCFAERFSASASRLTHVKYRELRTHLGVTQADLAGMLGVTRATINAREAGRAQITKEAELAIVALASKP